MYHHFPLFSLNISLVPFVFLLFSFSFSTSPLFYPIVLCSRLPFGYLSSLLTFLFSIFFLSSFNSLPPCISPLLYLASLKSLHLSSSYFTSPLSSAVLIISFTSLFTLILYSYFYSPLSAFLCLPASSVSYLLSLSLSLPIFLPSF